MTADPPATEDPRGRRSARSRDGLAEIALRAHVEPVGWRLRRRRRTQAPWSELALLLRTVAVPAAGEPLWFGAFAVLPRPGAEPIGEGLFYREGLPATDVAQIEAYAAEHGLPAPRPLGRFLAEFYRLAYKKRLPVVGFGLAADLARLAADWGAAEGRYADGFSLVLWTKEARPRARSKVERRRRPILRNGRIENGDRPRLCVKPIDGQRSFIGFTRRARPDPEDLVPEGEGGRSHPRYVFPGHLVDLRTFAFGLTGESEPSLASACRAFEIASPLAESPQGLSGRIDAARAELRQLGRLYCALLAEHCAHVRPEFLPPDGVYSPASYAEAYFEKAGLTPPLVKWPEFPRRALAQAMGAYFGGESGVGIRALPHPLPVSYLDFNGLYPLVAILTGAYEFLATEEVEVVEESPEAIRAWIEGLTTERLLDPALWKQLGLRFVEIVPDGDLLPHRVRSGKAWILKVAPLTSRAALPFTLADAVLSYLETGRLPNIVSAFRIVGRGRALGQRSLTLGSGRRVEPGEDLFLALGEERLRLAADPELPLAERKRRAGYYKLVANAACSGLFAQVNERPPKTRGERVRVLEPGGEQREQRLARIEEPGRWYFPPLPASINGAGRLLLHVTRLRFEAAGGIVAYMDTDSVAVVSTPHGGRVPCPGGAVETEDGRAAVPALSYAEVEAVRREVEALNPYPEEFAPLGYRYCPGAPAIDRFGQPLEQAGGYVGVRQPFLLKLEQENFDGGPAWPRQLYLHARASKNYELYSLDRPGPHVELAPTGAKVVLRSGPPEPEVVKASEHGLGHLLDQRDPAGGDKDWIAEGKGDLLRRDLGLTRRPLAWADEPGLSRLTLSRFDDLLRVAGPSRAARVRSRFRPLSKIAVAYPEPLTAQRAEAAGGRLVPVAPWHEGFDVRRGKWRDLTSGRPLRIELATGELRERDLAVGPRVRVQTMASLLHRNSIRTESKALAPEGDPCGPRSTGLLSPAPSEAYRVVLIGRETRNLDRIGVTDDPDYALYSDVEGETWWSLYLPALRAIAPTLPSGLAGLAREEGISRSTLLRLVSSGRASRKMRVRLAPVIGRLAAGALSDAARDAPAADPAKACYRYLRHAEESGPRCCLGCGTPLGDRQRKWCSRCRARPRVRMRARSPAPPARRSSHDALDGSLSV